MIIPVRRVVTGPNASGGTGVLKDMNAEHLVVLDPTSGLARTDIWATDTMPNDNINSTDPTENWPPERFSPLPYGTSFFVMQIPPDKKGEKSKLHRTETLDYIIILQGEIFVVFEDSE